MRKLSEGWEKQSDYIRPGKVAVDVHCYQTFLNSFRLKIKKQGKEGCQFHKVNIENNRNTSHISPVSCK